MPSYSARPGKLRTGSSWHTKKRPNIQGCQINSFIVSSESAVRGINPNNLSPDGNLIYRTSIKESIVAVYSFLWGEIGRQQPRMHVKVRQTTTPWLHPLPPPPLPPTLQEQCVGALKRHLFILTGIFVFIGPPLLTLKSWERRYVQKCTQQQKLQKKR